MPEPLPQGVESLRIRAVRRRRRQDRTAITFLLILALAVFTGGITWGLPSRESDKYLFGDRPAWSGEEIQSLTGQRKTTTRLGADVDRDPVAKAGGPVVLNGTDARRAEIVRRYRLFTYQPDEMVTMMALAEMRPGQGDFDPKLYQYGGLWIYPIGALLKIGSMLGIVRLQPDLAYYLDHPEAFARFYVVARLYVVAWAILGAWAVFALTRRLAGGAVLPACIACFCYIMMPVVVNMSHEAKPHLPGAVLMLLATLAAVRYVRTADAMWWLLASLLAGLAVGMVLAAWPILAVVPAATLLVRQDWRSRVRTCAWGAAISAATYFVTNPYVLINFFTNRQLLQSNLGNTRDMFSFGLSLDAVTNAVRLIAEGASFTLAGVGMLAAAALIIAASLRKNWALRSSAWLVVLVAGLGLVQFVLFAGGQPAEYGRFAVFADISLLIGAVVGGYFAFHWMEWRPEFLILLGLAAAIPGSSYYAGFVEDAGRARSRLMAAQVVEAKRQGGTRSVGVFAEPAPYAVPPINLFSGPVVLLPRGYNPAIDPNTPDVVVRTVDTMDKPPEAWMARYEFEFIDPLDSTAKMRWAAKPFLVMWKAADRTTPIQGGAVPVIPSTRPVQTRHAD